MSYSFPTNQPDGTEVTLANGVTYRFDATNDRWLVKSVSDDSVSIDDLFWEEIDTGSNQNPPLRLQITNSRPTGSGTEGLLHLWHGDPAQCTTSPNQEFKVWMRDGGAPIVDKYDDDGIVPEFEIRQGGKAMRMKGINGGWTTNVNTYHCSCEEVTGDVLSNNDPCEFWIRYDDNPFVELLDDRYVQKLKPGGEEVQGPLKITGEPGVPGRDTKRLETYGVFSGSESTALRLGTSRDRVYIGNDDTSFNGLVKVDEISEKNAGKGTTFDTEVHLKDTLTFSRAQEDLIVINPVNGTTQNINMFQGGNSDHTKVKVNLNGATWKNAIEFESGPSDGKEIMLSMDSNKAIKIREPSLQDTRIKDLADPVEDTDAVNRRYFENRITERLDSFITENSAGQMKWKMEQYPLSSGHFSTWTTNGGQTTTDPMQAREIWAHKYNMSGYQFHWEDVRPNTYLYMAGPNGALARFRVVADPINVSANSYWKIKVADPEITPADYKFSNDDQWDVVFRTFSGGNVDLDDYVTQEEFQALKDDLQSFKDDVDDRWHKMRLFESPFVSSSNNAVMIKPLDSNTQPSDLTIHGCYYGGSGAVGTNRYPANWNSHLRLGPGIIKIDQRGNKIDIPLDYEQEWSGTVSLYEFNSEVDAGSPAHVKLQLVFKNSVGLVRRPRSNGTTYIYFGSSSSGTERHYPEFARGDVQGDLEGKRVVVVLDLYRIGQLGDEPAGGNVTYNMSADATDVEPEVPADD